MGKYLSCLLLMTDVYGAIYEDYGEILPVLSLESSCQVFQDNRDIADCLQGFYYLCSTLDYK